MPSPTYPASRSVIGAIVRPPPAVRSCSASRARFRASSTPAVRQARSTPMSPCPKTRSRKCTPSCSPAAAPSASKPPPGFGATCASKESDSRLSLDNPRFRSCWEQSSSTSRLAAPPTRPQPTDAPPPAEHAAARSVRARSASAPAAPSPRPDAAIPPSRAVSEPHPYATSPVWSSARSSRLTRSATSSTQTPAPSSPEPGAKPPARCDGHPSSSSIDPCRRLRSGARRTRGDPARPARHKHHPLRHRHQRQTP